MADQEMILRISKSLFENSDYNWSWASTKNYNKLMEHQKEIINNLVKAAIKAMRDPTEKMLEAGDNLLNDTVECSTNVWQSMIDAILND